MKALLLLLLSVTAQAAPNYSVENEAGGRIVITNSTCDAPNKGYLSFAYDSRGNVTLYGCALPFDSHSLLVVWEDNDVTMLPLDNLEYRE